MPPLPRERFSPLADLSHAGPVPQEGFAFPGTTGLRLRFHPIDATQALNRWAGVS
jgi:hypothetical protein